MRLRIPAQLVRSCAKAPERARWLRGLPDIVQDLERRWFLQLGPPFSGASCAWVAPAIFRDGTHAVLKIGMPHMEAEHELGGLLFWDGNPTVRVLECDPMTGAMVLERCKPGTELRRLPEPEQDVVIAGLFHRLWRMPARPHSFRPLSLLMDHWSAETLAASERWPDPALVREGLRLFHDLPRSAPMNVLLATDLHAGNVLRAERAPWLVIDPKPFAGDPAYDATQHLINCRERLRSDPKGTIDRMADLLGLDRDRVRVWTFARLAADPRADWENDDSAAIARAIARCGHSANASSG